MTSISPSHKPSKLTHEIPRSKIKLTGNCDVINVILVRRLNVLQIPLRGSNDAGRGFNIRFYKGWAIYPLGWKDIEVDVIEGIEDKRHSIVKAKLRSLGQLISGDWAKHNNVRHITTAMLALWGEVIQAAVEFDKGEATVDQVTADVLDLLSGNLSPKAIELGRYQTKLGLSLREPLIYFE